MPTDEVTCPICDSEARRFFGGMRDTCKVSCPRCGEFEVTREALMELLPVHYSKRQIANIIGWLQNNQGYVISSDKVNLLSTIKAPGFSERADLLLSRIGNETDYAGQGAMYDVSWASVSWSVNQLEVEEILKFLKDTDRVAIVKQPGRNIACVVRPNGWLRLDEISKPINNSNQGFVAMWFHECMSKIYAEAISKAVEDAGYRPHRVDNREHNGKIDDEIVAEIRKSKFVVADFTGQRGGVYYEAGFAKGLGIEVFWTCRDVHFKRLHFDIRQYNCIQWSINDLEGFRRQLHHRIESVLGQGPVRK